MSTELAAATVAHTISPIESKGVPAVKTASGVPVMAPTKSKTTPGWEGCPGQLAYAEAHWDQRWSNLPADGDVTARPRGEEIWVSARFPGDRGPRSHLVPVQTDSMLDACPGGPLPVGPLA